MGKMLKYVPSFLGGWLAKEATVEAKKGIGWGFIIASIVGVMIVGGIIAVYLWKRKSAEKPAEKPRKRGRSER